MEKGTDDLRQVYKAPCVVKMNELTPAAGWCVPTGSGDVQGCCTGNTASTGCGTGNNASGVEGCIHNGNSASGSGGCDATGNSGTCSGD